MKTHKDKKPNGSRLDFKVIDQFLKNQIQLLELLHTAKYVNLNKIKTKITISKVIKLKLGDTLRFMVYHNERHIIQAERAIDSFTSPK